MGDPRAVSATYHGTTGSAVTPVDVQGNPAAKAIGEAMDLVVQCGAREGTDEHYMATKALRHR